MLGRGKSNISRMKKLTSLSIPLSYLLLSSLFGVSQVKSVEQNTGDFKTDSTELRTLIFKMLKWHENDRGEDFPPTSDKANDSVYSGINWAAHQKRVKQLESTGFFAKEFISRYQKIAGHLDKELKSNKEKYHVGELPPYDHANEWCDCQDYPTNVWTLLKIINLKINGNSATFKWTWSSNFSYSVKALKADGKWKIAELEKFDVKNFTW
jgi:hypothetical protein